MIDLHSHILPNMDDGSKNAEESCKLLKMLAAQGVKYVAATPHYNAAKESAVDFFARRQAAFAEISNSKPQILLGAEVKYYSGISRRDDLKALCIEKSRLLLLEMPFSKWTEYNIKELIEIACRGEVTVVLAHIERYLRFQKADTLERLLDVGILMQSNVSFFTDFLTRRKAIKMLTQGQIHFLGSDCHNIESRAPKISLATQQIVSRLGNRFFDELLEFAESKFEI